MDYFSHDIYSNSFLSVLKEQIKNKGKRREFKIKPEFFQFGHDFEDNLQYYKHSENPIITRMSEKVRESEFYQSILSHPNRKTQYEFYRKFYGLNFKCKVDELVPGTLVTDIKSTSATTIQGFLKCLDRFDYDRQIYIYMCMSRCDNGAFIACSKQKNPRVFVVSVKKGDYIWSSGKQKTEELINVLKALL